MAYCSARDLTDYLGLTNTDDNSLLDTLIRSAKAVIDKYTGRTFEATADSTRYFDAVKDVDGRVLWFDTHCASITSIVNGDGATVSASNYATEPRNTAPYYAVKLKGSSSVVWVGESDGDNENAISVTGRWAYSTTAPDDIKFACIRLAAYLYRQKDNANDLDRAIVAGNSTVLPAQIPSDIRLILDPYKGRI